MEHWKALLDLPILELHYEELVADQEGQTRRLLEFCELPWDDACLRFHESGRVAQTLSVDQVRQGMYSSSVGRAERFGGSLGALETALRNELAPIDATL